MSDRIVVMNAGRVEQDGRPEELYFHPANRFVAEFVGDTNLISGRVRGHDGEDVLIDWFGETLRGHTRTGAPQPEGDVTASVRLERLGLHLDKPATANAVRGRVIGKTFLGSRMVIDLQVEQAPGVTLRAYVDTLTGKAVGDAEAWVGWDADSMAVLSD